MSAKIKMHIAAYPSKALGPRLFPRINAASNTISRTKVIIPPLEPQRNIVVAINTAQKPTKARFPPLTSDSY